MKTMSTRSIKDILYRDYGWVEGRMISASKSQYRAEHLGNQVMFNANVVDSNGTKLWHGDIDLTVHGHILQAVAHTAGKKLFVLYESDCRFATEMAPDLNRAVWTSQ